MVIRHLKAEDQAVFLAFCQDFYSGGAVLHAVDPDNFRRTFEACVSGNPYTEGFLLEVDGGVDNATAPQCVEAGADILVAGSAVFGAADPAAAVQHLASL